MSGTVFAMLGFVGLILIITLATITVRRRRNNRLVEEAVSFDPAVHMEATKAYDEKSSLRAGAAPAPSSQFGPGNLGLHSTPSLRPAPGARVRDDYGYYNGSGPAHHYPVGQYHQHYDHVGQYQQHYGPPPGYP